MDNRLLNPLKMKIASDETESVNEEAERAY